MFAKSADNVDTYECTGENGDQTANSYVQSAFNITSLN